MSIDSTLTCCIQDFEDAKRREIAADAPKEIDTTIPGWVRSSDFIILSSFLINDRVLGQALA